MGQYVPPSEEERRQKDPYYNKPTRQELAAKTWAQVNRSLGGPRAPIPCQDTIEIRALYDAGAPIAGLALAYHTTIKKVISIGTRKRGAWLPEQPDHPYNTPPLFTYPNNPRHKPPEKG